MAYVRKTSRVFGLPCRSTVAEFAEFAEHSPCIADNDSDHKKLCTPIAHNVLEDLALAFNIFK